MKKHRYKYSATFTHYIGCPTHEGTGSHYIQFFNSIKDFLIALLNNKNIGEYSDLYSNSRGYEILEYSIDFGPHSVIGFDVKIRNIKLKTIDDGRGNLIWINKELL